MNPTQKKFIVKAVLALVIATVMLIMLLPLTGTSLSFFAAPYALLALVYGICCGARLAELEFATPKKSSKPDVSPRKEPSSNFLY